MEERWRQSQEDAFSFGFHVSHSMPARYKWNLARVLPPPELSQAEVEFPCALDLPESDLNGTDRSQDLMFILACMQMIVAPWFALAGRKFFLQEGNDITASYGSGHDTCPGPGNFNLI